VAVDETIRKQFSFGKTCVYVAVENELAGVMLLADVIKDSAAEAISQLRAMGLEIGMITGDRSETARSIADELGIDRIMAEVLPHEKSGAIKQLQDQGKVVAWWGMGIN